MGGRWVGCQNGQMTNGEVVWDRNEQREGNCGRWGKREEEEKWGGGYIHFLLFLMIMYCCGYYQLDLRSMYSCGMGKIGSIYHVRGNRWSLLVVIGLL